MGKLAKGHWVRVIDAAGAPRHYKIGEVGKVESDDGVLTRLEGKGGGMYSHRFEAWQPKVGERVRFVNDNPNGGASYGKKGEEAIVAKEAVGNSHYGPQVQIKHPAHDWNPSAPISALEPLPATGAAPVAAEAQPATLTIEAGKFYKTRDGRKVGPITPQAPGRYHEAYIWNVGGNAVTAKGENLLDCVSANDLVALWEEPAVAVAASNDNAPAAEQPAAEKPKFKVGDRVVTSAVTDAGVGIVREVYANRSYLVDFKDTWYRTCTEREKVLSLAAPLNPAIVALIENGTAKPATRPKVHADQASATSEAERLALEFPGQQFGVFVLAESKIADVVTETVQRTVLRAA